MASPSATSESNVVAAISRLGSTLESLQQSVQDSQDHHLHHSETMEKEVQGIRSQLNRLELMMSTILDRLNVQVTATDAPQSFGTPAPKNEPAAAGPQSMPYSAPTQKAPTTAPATPRSGSQSASTTEAASATREENPWIVPESWDRRAKGLRRQGAFYGVPDWDSMQDVGSCNTPSSNRYSHRREGPSHGTPPWGGSSGTSSPRRKPRPLRREGARYIPGLPLGAARRSAAPEPSTRSSSRVPSVVCSPSLSPSTLETIREMAEVEAILNEIQSEDSASEYLIHDDDSGYADTDLGSPVDAVSAASDGDISDGSRSDFSDGYASSSSRKRSREPEDDEASSGSGSAHDLMTTSSLVHDMPTPGPSRAPPSPPASPTASTRSLPIPAIRDDGSDSDGSSKRRRVSDDKENARAKRGSPHSTTGSGPRRNRKSSAIRHST